MNIPSPPPFSVGQRFQIGDYHCSSGWTARITLPNGKIAFTGIQSINSMCAKELGYTVETVRYQGNCIDAGIEERAITGAPIWINGEYITNRPELFATNEELVEFKLRSI